jgi:hypothetical protein
MKTRQIAPKIFATLLIVVITATGIAQPDSHTAKRTMAIARKVASLPLHAKISVIPLDGPEQYGEFLSNDSEGFTFRDVDRQAEVTFNFAEVKKIKNGYGGYNSFAGRHTDRTKNLIFSACVLGMIGSILAALASASN